MTLAQGARGELVPVRRWQLLYSPRAWRRWIAQTSARLKLAHVERNYATVADDIAAGATVLDVGAWDGQLGARLAERKGCQVTLVDVVDKNETALPLRRYDGRTLPCREDERFDVVQLLYVLHHADDDLQLLREARRVVADDGRVLVAEDLVETRRQRWVTRGFHVWLFAVTWMPQRGRFRTRAEWRRRFAAAGFTVEAERELGSEGDRRLWPENLLYVLRPARPSA
ncbi:MAG: class I SAM-dependent methyltransferase [Kofleriaceae bacterium]